MPTKRNPGWGEAFPCTCGGKSAVVDSRPYKDGYVYRRRKCLDCGSYVSSYEYQGLKPRMLRKMQAELFELADKLDTVLVSLADRAPRKHGKTGQASS